MNKLKILKKKYAIFFFFNMGLFLLWSGKPVFLLWSVLVISIWISESAITGAMAGVGIGFRWVGAGLMAQFRQSGGDRFAGYFGNGADAGGGGGYGRGQYKGGRLRRHGKGRKFPIGAVVVILALVLVVTFFSFGFISGDSKGSKRISPPFFFLTVFFYLALGRVQFTCVDWCLCLWSVCSMEIWCWENGGLGSSAAL